MAQKDRLPLFPSRTNQVLMKNRVISAIRGLNLLQRKRDALKLKLREMESEYKEKESHIFSVMGDALSALSRANYAGADLKLASLINPDRADVYMRIKYNKVVGIQMPFLQLYVNRPESCPYAGLARGGEEVLAVRTRFQEALKELVATASLQYSIIALKSGLRQTTMRCNGLEYVLIPRFQNTLLYILNELEELEREDFYRLKRSQAKQSKAKAAFSEIVKSKNLAAEERQLLDAAVKRKASRIRGNYGIDEMFDVSAFEKDDDNNELPSVSKNLESVNANENNKPKGESNVNEDNDNGNDPNRETSDKENN